MSTTTSTRRTIAGLAAVLALAATACSSSDDGTVSADGGGASPSTTAAPTPIDACDVSLNPVGYWEDAELAGTVGAEFVPQDHDHGDEAPATTVAADPDDPNDMSGGLGELGAAQLIVALTDLPQDEYEQWLQSLDPDRDVEAPDDTGAGGHLGPQTWDHLTDADECAELEAELETAREVALRYPKASDAIAAGYVRVAPYLPGIASHWMNFRYVDGTFDVEEPEMLLYDGNDEDSNIVGLSYFVRKAGDEEPLVGFAGNNDHYHRHVGLCVAPDRGVIGDSSTTEEECEAAGGFKNDRGNGWMSHAWVVPGCESPWGVFSAQNPILDDDLGHASGDGEPCSGSVAKERWDLSPGGAEDESAAG